MHHTFHCETSDVHNSSDPFSQVQKGAGHETMIIDEPESESEPDLEVWEENEDELLQDTEPPDPIDTCKLFDTVPSSSRALLNWILCFFFMVMQAAFRLPVFCCP